MAELSPVAVSVRDEIQRPKSEVKPAKPASDKGKVASVSAASPRKLIRPKLQARAPGSLNLGLRGLDRRKYVRGVPTLSTATPGSAEPATFPEQTSHAETFYLQKQAQSQTLMIFVLDDGEQIGGYIEWYDRDVIKVRRGSRTLIYKSSIKYLYKAEENIRV